MRGIASVVAGIALMVSACLASSAETLSTADFTGQFAAALEQAAPAARVTVTGPLRLSLRSADGTSRTVNLDNAYREYRGSPERFGELVGIFAEAVKHPVPPRLDRARIVPMIKDRAWLAEIDPIFRAQGAELLFDDFNAELVVVYVEDSDTRARYLGSRDDIGDRKALRSLALDNLVRLLPKIERHDFGPFSVIAAGGNYEPSLLLLDDIWSGGQLKLDGDIVVAVPARDVLLVTGSHSREGLKAVRDMTKKMVQGPYRLTDTLFVYRAGAFVPFVGE